MFANSEGRIQTIKSLYFIKVQ